MTQEDIKIPKKKFKLKHGKEHISAERKLCFISITTRPNCQAIWKTYTVLHTIDPVHDHDLPEFLFPLTHYSSIFKAVFSKMLQIILTDLHRMLPC
jgi:hypothetical protein